MLATMPELVDECSPLLPVEDPQQSQDEATSQSWLRQLSGIGILKDKTAIEKCPVGERLPYENYASVDFLHDLVKDSHRYRHIRSKQSLKWKCYALFDDCTGWIMAAAIGGLTACVAFVVDICEATISDWKVGYCKNNVLLNRDGCCSARIPSGRPLSDLLKNPQGCDSFHTWAQGFWQQFAAYSGFALIFGLVTATATLSTKSAMPTALGRMETRGTEKKQPTKYMYLAAGSGIPEIKTVLSGFVIPGLLSLKVLLVKGFGAVFAVASSMCLGKEGPFVHISGCVGYLVATCLPKYRNNGRKLREILSAAVASGLSVAFGAPIGGVMFAYEEISYAFPRQVLWHAFLCSLTAAVVLKALNPSGTGKLILFETDYGITYEPHHYLVFIFLGLAGGIWGGLFCKLNFKWSKWFRSYLIIKNYPVVEVFLVVLVTVLVQFPNPLVRDQGDIMIRKLLVNCNTGQIAHNSYICQSESGHDRGRYLGWLLYGCVAKLILTTVTFGAKVPSGIIIPALDAGALFGRFVGQAVTDISPGIFAMVGAGAFLAGVSRMTISLCVIMFELTGEVEYVVPHMIAILVAKCVADWLSSDSVYDLAQNVLGHPFLDFDRSLFLVKQQPQSQLASKLTPPPSTMQDITVVIDEQGRVGRGILERKLRQLQERGLMDAGLVIVEKSEMVRGYIAQTELEYGLTKLAIGFPLDCTVCLLDPDGQLQNNAGVDNSRLELGSLAPGGTEPTLDLTHLLDRSPMMLSEAAPLEYAVEMFGKLGLRYLVLTREFTGTLAGVVIKKRMVKYLDELQEGGTA